MSLRSILLLLDDTPSCAGRTRFAIQLAKAHGSRLVGLATTGFADFPVSVEGAASLFEYADIAWRAVRERAERTAHAFDQACEGTALEVETIVEQGAEAMSIMMHAQYNDLVLVGQADPTASNSFFASRIVQNVVMEGPRPTLLIPYAGRFETPARTAMVAWDGSREAGRALCDSLPFLRRCEVVWLEAWPEAGAEASSLRPRLQAVCEWLARHDVRARPSCEGAPVAAIADAIRLRAADRGADLIVMGAYGHSRWSEAMLGGATRGLLEAMTVPVLMSH